MVPAGHGSCGGEPVLRQETAGDRGHRAPGSAARARGWGSLLDGVAVLAVEGVEARGDHDRHHQAVDGHNLVSRARTGKRYNRQGQGRQRER